MKKIGLIILLFSLNLFAEQLYQKTEPLISNLLRADLFSKASFNQQGTALIKRYMQYTPSIEYVSRPQMKLGGLRFNPENYRSTVTSYTRKLVYFNLKEKRDREISFGSNAIIGGLLWADDAKNVLVGVETRNCYQLWVVRIPSLQKKQVPGVCMNDVMTSAFFWVDSNRVLILQRTPEQKNMLNVIKKIPTGPVIQESGGKVAQNRTFADLLKSQQDEKTFEQAVKSQPVILDVRSFSLTKIGSPDLYENLDFSPDLKHILVTRIVRPYSYVVPMRLFARQTEIWGNTGRKTHSLFKTGPHENVPIEGTVTGPRSIRWLADEDATVIYVSALDGGDWNTKVEFRDELFKLKLLPSGKFESQSFYKTKSRFENLSVLDRRMGYLVTDYERDTKWVTLNWLKEQSGKEILAFNEDDAYNDPGSAFRTDNERHRTVIAVAPDNESIFFSGEGATPQGYRPFLNKLNLKTGIKTELFRSEEKSYESFITFLDKKKFSSFITVYETDQVSPRYMLTKDGNKELLYKDKNPFEIVAKIKREVIKYKRADDLELSGTLYYPLGYEEGKKYPLILDAYPLEYLDAGTAGQVRSSSYTFDVPYRADVLYFALRGYVVLKDAQIPIVGPAKTKNDKFLPQLIDGAAAAIKAVEKKGLIDPKRVGVIGHSYGAFMVANLLTHTQMFAAGIARSGAYNRTLTPFGFQGESRSFWDAKDLYMKVSPFYEAEKMKSPLLLIHGQSDNNSGTFTLQSERYFDALKGQGARARLVLLPEESHSYAAMESVEHVLWEEFNWFDTYLK